MIIVKFMRFRRLIIYFNAFHLVLSNVHSCLKMTVKTETCGIVEYNKFLTVRFILIPRKVVTAQ
jgi:hypothetical protein